MFDWFEPSDHFRCPLCADSLDGWQGKDGPCGLFVWREGVAHPVDQRIDEEVALEPDRRAEMALPETFEIYTYCSNHHRVSMTCRCQDGVWSQNGPLTAKALKKNNRAR